MRVNANAVLRSWTLLAAFGGSYAPGNIHWYIHICIYAAGVSGIRQCARLDGSCHEEREGERDTKTQETHSTEEGTWPHLHVHVNEICAEGGGH